MGTGVKPTITLTDEGEWWVAKDTDTGVVSQGESRTEALDNLDEALEGYHGEGREPTTEELREAGIKPGKNVSSNGRHGFYSRLRDLLPLILNRASAARRR